MFSSDGITFGLKNSRSSRFSKGCLVCKHIRKIWRHEAEFCNDIRRVVNKELLHVDVSYLTWKQYYIDCIHSSLIRSKIRRKTYLLFLFFAISLFTIMEKRKVKKKKQGKTISKHMCTWVIYPVCKKIKSHSLDYMYTD